MKLCPYCAEDILDSVIVCPYCKRRIVTSDFEDLQKDHQIDVTKVVTKLCPNCGRELSKTQCLLCGYGSPQQGEVLKDVGKFAITYPLTTLRLMLFIVMFTIICLVFMLVNFPG